MTLLHVVMAWAGEGRAPQIQLCGAYLSDMEARDHVVQAQTLNPHLTFDMRVCPFPAPHQETP